MNDQGVRWEEKLVVGGEKARALYRLASERLPGGGYYDQARRSSLCPRCSVRAGMIIQAALGGHDQTKIFKRDHEPVSETTPQWLLRKREATLIETQSCLAGARASYIDGPAGGSTLATKNFHGFWRNCLPDAV